MGRSRILHAVLDWLETRAGRRAFWVAVGAAFVVMGILTIWRAEVPRSKLVAELKYSSPIEIGESRDAQAVWHSSEFRAFRIVSWGAVMEGKDPYRDLGNVRAYPPFFGIAFFPFAVFWKIPGAGSALFFVTSFAFALLSARCCSRCLAGDGKGRFGLFALAFILLAPLALDVMARCESDMLILLPIAAAFLWIVQGRNAFRAGALLGFAASFKVLPGLFGVYLICTRQWRALLGMICAGIVCMGVLPLLVWGPKRTLGLHQSWYEVVVAPYHGGGAGAIIGNAYRPSNQSLTAGLNRLLRPLPIKERGSDDADSGQACDRNVSILSLPKKVVALLVKSLQLLVGVGLVALWAMAGRGRSAKAAAILMAAAAPGILLLSEVSLTTHHVLLFLPLAAIIARIVELDDSVAKRWEWVIWVYLLAVLGVAIPFAKSYTPLLPATAAALWACAAIALRDRAESLRLPSL